MTWRLSPSQWTDETAFKELVTHFVQSNVTGKISLFVAGDALVHAPMSLERLRRQQGITTLYALVAAPVGENPHLTMDSPRFHAAMGYTEVGRLHRCGEKFGLRMDLTYWEKILEG